MALHIKNLEHFTRHVDSWVDKVGVETAQVANGMAVEMFEMLLKISPQYSGDFAANWQYSRNIPNTNFSELNLLDQDPSRTPFGAGSRPAINYATVMNKGRDTFVKLGDTFYLSNSAAHHEPYALKIERNTINFRTEAGNAGKVVERTVNYLWPTYTSLNALQVKRLRGKKL